MGSHERVQTLQVRGSDKLLELDLDGEKRFCVKHHIHLVLLPVRPEILPGKHGLNIGAENLLNKHGEIRSHDRKSDRRVNHVDLLVPPQAGSSFVWVEELRSSKDLIPSGFDSLNLAIVAEMIWEK